MHDIFSKNLILDGAMGSLIIERASLPAGYKPELVNIENPKIVQGIHRDYIEAGADVVYTNTFGLNVFNFDEKELESIVKAAIANAKAAKPKFVALDIGPTGKVIGQGGITFEEAVDAFKTVIKIAADSTDLIVIETMTSLSELRAAVIAAKEISQLPVFASMSFSENGRTFFGTSVKIFAAVAEGLGVSAVGANCSLGSVQMKKIASELVSSTSLPVFIKPNAGLPVFSGGKTIYNESAEDFSKAMAEISALGVNILGGCCGTTPDYIKQLKGKVKYFKPNRKAENSVVACSAVREVSGSGLKYIGERLNPSGKKNVKDALYSGDYDYLVGEALKQEEQGADLIDVNAGLSNIDEASAMGQLFDRLQQTVSLPLVVDSSKYEVIEKILREYQGKAIVNSVNGAKDSLNSILPLVKKYGAAVIGLTLDESGIPETAEGRVEIAKKIINACLNMGIKKENIIIDTLTMAQSTNKNSACITLDALKQVKKIGVKTVLGVSNISFGMPNREDINAKFLEMAKNSGLDFAIINPSFIGLSGSELAHDFLLGKEGAVEKFIENSTNNKTEKQEITNKNETLLDAVVCGRDSLAQRLAAEMLMSVPPLDVIQQHIIPALDEVGRLYEEGKLYLPQLIASSEAAKAAFKKINEKIALSGEKQQEKLRFVLATVKGDIHDIGKNIVKTVVSNYGFKVIDLGRDVDTAAVLAAVEKNYPCVLGLSSLMTTTAENLKKTVEEVQKQFDIPVLVGGAVLNNEFAKEIGAIYCKDARDAVLRLNEICDKK